jgi:hypothetical protein
MMGSPSCAPSLARVLHTATDDHGATGKLVYALDRLIRIGSSAMIRELALTDKAEFQWARRRLARLASAKVRSANIADATLAVTLENPIVSGRAIGELRAHAGATATTFITAFTTSSFSAGHVLVSPK